MVVPSATACQTMTTMATMATAGTVVPELASTTVTSTTMTGHSTTGYSTIFESTAASGANNSNIPPTMTGAAPAMPTSVPAMPGAAPTMPATASTVLVTPTPLPVSNVGSDNSTVASQIFLTVQSSTSCSAAKNTFDSLPATGVNMQLQQ